jgi:hypothetical protein
MTFGQYLGVAFLLVGIVGTSSYTEIWNFRIPLFYNELTPMKERWGFVTGTVLHVIEYVFIPLVIGILLMKGVGF